MPIEATDLDRGSHTSGTQPSYVAVARRGLYITSILLLTLLDN